MHEGKLVSVVLVGNQGLSAIKFSAEHGTIARRNVAMLVCDWGGDI